MKKRVVEKQLSDKLIKTASLDMDVEWTPAAKKSIREGEYRYFSIEFSFEWTNSETQEKVSNIVTGGALTNKPFLKQPALNLSDAGENLEEIAKMTKNEILLALKEDHSIDLASLETKAKENIVLSEQIKKLSDANADLEKKVKSIELAKKEQEIGVLLSQLLSEGKSTKIQNETVYLPLFMSTGIEKAKEIAKSLPKVIKTEPMGVGATGQHTEFGDEDEDVKRDRLALAEQAKNPKLSYEDALRLADKSLGFLEVK